jgi:hypothetical protein
MARVLEQMRRMSYGQAPNDEPAERKPAARPPRPRKVAA